MWFHWQNLNEKKFGKMGSGLWHGRAWLHLGGNDRRCIGVEWCIPGHFCHLGFKIGDDWQMSIAPFWLFGLWITLEGFRILNRWTPKRRCVAIWDDNREFFLNDERECKISFHDWTLHINPWSKHMEWSKADPWWVRGISWNLPDFFLGRARYTCNAVSSFDIEIPMPEKNYPAKVTIEHRIWKRPLWFARVCRDANVDISGGIPFPGKGENSWDCGMDGLFGYGCSSTKPEDVITQGVKSVLESRRRYGGSVNWQPEEYTGVIG